MSSYPTQLTQLLTSTEGFVDDIMIDRAVGGSPRGRALYPAIKRRFVLKHRCSPANFNTYVRDFYIANRLLTVALTWARTGAAYTVIYESAPTFTTPEPNIVDAQVIFVEQ